MIDNYIPSPAKGGAISKWLTPCPAVLIPDKPTAAVIRATDKTGLQPVYPAAMRNTAGNPSPETRIPLGHIYSCKHPFLPMKPK